MPSNINPSSDTSIKGMDSDLQNPFDEFISLSIQKASTKNPIQLTENVFKTLSRTFLQGEIVLLRNKEYAIKRKKSVLGREIFVLKDPEDINTKDIETDISNLKRKNPLKRNELMIKIRKFLDAEKKRNEKINFEKIKNKKMLHNLGWLGNPEFSIKQNGINPAPIPKSDAPIPVEQKIKKIKMTHLNAPGPQNLMTSRNQNIQNENKKIIGLTNISYNEIPGTVPVFSSINSDYTSLFLEIYNFLDVYRDLFGFKDFDFAAFEKYLIFFEKSDIKKFFIYFFEILVKEDKTDNKKVSDLLNDVNNNYLGDIKAFSEDKEEEDEGKSEDNKEFIFEFSKCGKNFKEVVKRFCAYLKKERGFNTIIDLDKVFENLGYDLLKMQAKKIDLSYSNNNVNENILNGNLRNNTNSSKSLSEEKNQNKKSEKAVKAKILEKTIENLKEVTSHRLFLLKLIIEIMGSMPTFCNTCDQKNTKNAALQKRRQEINAELRAIKFDLRKEMTKSDSTPRKTELRQQNSPNSNEKVEKESYSAFLTKYNLKIKEKEIEAKQIESEIFKNRQNSTIGGIGNNQFFLISKRRVFFRDIKKSPKKIYELDLKNAKSVFHFLARGDKKDEVRNLCEKFKMWGLF